MDLSEDEVSQVQTLIKKGKHLCRAITRAHILLMTSEGEIDQAIASTLQVHISTVERLL